MANMITIARLPMLFIYLGIMYFGGVNSLFWNVPFIILIFLLDSLDGWVARQRGEDSLLGSVLDIATDRTLEYVLWVVYAHLGLIPVIVPVIVLLRGTAVDAIRAVGMKSGRKAFDQIQSPLNQYLVSSRFMRGIYGFSKGAAAALLTLSFALQMQASPLFDAIYLLAMIFTWLSVALCLIRGYPVLAEGIHTLQKNHLEYGGSN